MSKFKRALKMKPSRRLKKIFCFLGNIYHWLPEALNGMTDNVFDASVADQAFRIREKLTSKRIFEQWYEYLIEG